MFISSLDNSRWHVFFFLSLFLFRAIASDDYEHNKTKKAEPFNIFTIFLCIKMEMEWIVQMRNYSKQIDIIEFR